MVWINEKKRKEKKNLVAREKIRSSDIWTEFGD